MTTKKILIPTIATVFVFVVSITSDTTSAAQSNALESSCYSLLLEQVDDLAITEKEALLSLLPDNYSGLNQSLFIEEESASGPPTVKTNFKNPLFRKRKLQLGEALAASTPKESELLNLGNDSATNNSTTSLFDVEFSYDLDDGELLWCKAVLREIKEDGITPADIDSGLIVHYSYPQRVSGNVANISKDGKSFKTIIIEKDKMDADYAKVIYTMHMIMAAPESSRTDFNPYILMNAFAEATNSYYTKFIPAIESKIEGKSDIAKEIISDGEVKIEGYINTDGSRIKVYGIRPVTFNNQIINEYSYIPWLRYYLVEEMVKLGQSDVTNLWLSHMSSEDLYNIVNFYNDSISLAESGLDASARDNNLDNQIDRFVDMAVSIGAEEGAAEPNKTDSVKLFWRLKTLIDGGASDVELEEYIADYPEHLRVVAEVEAKNALQRGLKDVDVNAWYAPFVADLVEKEVVAGYPDETYRPGNSLNRAEIAKIVVELFDLEVPTSVATNPFPDVDKNAWFAPYVAAAKNAAAVGGYPDGSFQPGGVVNRAEAMKMILTASGVNIPNSASSNFSDVSSSDWFAKFVDFANAQEIVAGYADGKFKPSDQINRAEIAKIASLAKQILKKTVRRAQ
ncbi:S-layer homology domain-containing protein [Candidatus Gracilibacteria bacterium]|nr:S-layer homology domain-containing protein [Candidatus Gracilibacteria bacterium]MCF7856062.1 S-layer homology domain-containing protein [Candidatus Gracilibacteria bacterium]MCF7896383.1 S-layer homology domain-containing protein [Candidatus Gracilibacteria bacterium]